MNFIQENSICQENSLLNYINPPILLENLKYESTHRFHKKDKNFRFTDTEFSPNVLSLTNSEETKCKFSNTRWAKPLEIFKKKFNFFSGPVKPSNIFQYNYEKFYWISCLCIISEQKFLLDRLFLNNSFNEQGIYSVFLNKNGQWKDIIIDDKFPINNEK